MWPRSHCTRRCRPTAFAGHHRRWRSYSKGSDSSERYSRSSPGRALSCMWIRRWLTLEEALNMLQRWCVERRRRKPNWRAAIGTPPEGLGKMDVSCTSWLLRTRPRSAAAVGGVRRVQTARRPLGAARAQPRTGIACAALHIGPQRVALETAASTSRGQWRQGRDVRRGDLRDRRLTVGTRLSV